MKVLDLELTNFSRVYTGMGVTHLYIDFTEFKNKIFLFLGANGSGKTSIMRCIHPFAFNTGAGDTTSNADLIIEGEDGKKIIQFQDGTNVYTITHVYNRQKTGAILTKSFISLNGEELNDSGTVTTFKDIIMNRFGIDESYLTLISLGNTIKGFVEFSSGDRKQLAIKIFQELNIYNRFYKNASVQVREKKALLSNIAVKLDRYKQYSKEELQSTSNQIEIKKQDMNEKLNTLMMNAGGILQQIENNNEFISSYNEKKELVNELFDKINTLKSRITVSGNDIAVKNEIDEMTSTINQMEIRVSSLELSIKSELDLKDVKLSSLESLRINLKQIESNANVVELEEVRANITRELITLEQIEEFDIDPSITAEQLIRSSVYLKELHGMCVDLIMDANDDEIIKTAFEKYKSNDKFFESVEAKLNATKVKAAQYDMIETHGTIGHSVTKIKLDCEKPCPYREFYETYTKYTQNKELELKEEYHKTMDELHTAEQIFNIVNTIKRLYGYIKRNKESFEIIPSNIFDPTIFVLIFLKNREIYDATMLSNVIDYLEHKKRRKELRERLQEVEQSINSAASTKKAYDDIKLQIEKLEQSILDMDEKIAWYRKDFDFNNNQLLEVKETKESLMKQYSYVIELKENREQLEDVKKSLSSMEDTMTKIQTLQGKLQLLREEEERYKAEIAEYEKQQRTLELTIATIDDLEREQIELSERYNKAVMIRDAVSPSKGIPLEFINFYIKDNLIGMVNNLLDSVYHGKLQLLPDKTCIDENEFTIPYRRRGVIVKDISKASDGERAIMTLAFSLVLIQLSEREIDDSIHSLYNILLSDEMDTTLDVHTRPLFIQMIEHFMASVKAEQMFLISHNSTFDVYPVNILMTSETNVSNMTNIQIKKLYE